MDLVHGGYLGPGGFMPPGGPGGLIATWPTTVAGVPWGRYFIVDGDAGLDTNLGYIDAPLGTVFTPAQTAAVAIKTTSRLEAIVPAVGAGRNYVILIKPRAGRAIYDAVVAGDEQGSFRRDLRVGYAMEVMRGSDFTNSAADRAQLGMVTVVGPLTVQSIAMDAHGPYVKFTTPVGILPQNLPKYRMRALTAFGTFYSSCWWGDPAVVPDPTIIHTAFFGPGSPLAPGDPVWLEEPGVRLRDFSEAVVEATRSVGPLPSEQRLWLAGVEVGADTSGFPPLVRLGANINGTPPNYCCVRASSVSLIVGSLTATDTFIDELGNTTLVSSFGIDMWGCTCASQVDRVDISRSYLNNSINITAKRISIATSFVLLLNLAGGADGMVVDNVNYQQIFLNPRGLCTVSGNWVPLDVNQNGVMLTPDQGSRAAFTIGTLTTFYGPEPAAPGIIMYPGQYSVTFDLFNTFGPTTGTGLLVKHDSVEAQTLVTYASLRITGFEVEGGQRVAVLTGDPNYPSHTLPCPRGIVMRMVDGVAGTAYPVGLVVTAPAATPTRFALALADDVANMRVVGALLTNVVQGDGGTPNGWAVVGYGGFMSLRQEVGSANPVSGDLLYLSAAQPGFVTLVPIIPNMLLGRATPIGPNIDSTGDVVPAAWDPVQA